MPYCKHCENHIASTTTIHNCRKAGLLNVDEDDSFLVSTLIGAVTDSAIVGGLLGGNIVGGVLGDMLNGDLFD